MGHVISTVIVGLIVGILARFFYPGAVHMGWIASILLGIGGSIIGGLVPRLLSRASASRPFHPAGIIGSVLGAMVLIFIARHFLHLV